MALGTDCWSMEDATAIFLAVPEKLDIFKSKL